nr:FAD-binding oxidoreductase [Paenibacillus terrae]
MNKQKIVIIGAGIVGASLAYHLAKRNQDVTVIERHSAPKGATSPSKIKPGAA